MNPSQIQPALVKAQEVQELIADVIKLLRQGNHEDSAKIVLSKTVGPLGALVTELGKLFPEALHQPLRFEVQTPKYNPGAGEGEEEYPESPAAMFTISLMSGIEVTCCPLADVEKMEKPIVFIEQQTTGKIIAVNSPDGGDPACVVTFMPDGKTLIDDIPDWRSMVRDIRNTPFCGLVHGSFTTGFHVVGPFRTHDDAKEAFFYREGDIIIDFLKSGKKDKTAAAKAVA